MNNWEYAFRIFNENNGYSYDDAVKLKNVTQQEAKKEIQKHGANWEEFIEDVGNKPKYNGKEILDWLGY